MLARIKKFFYRLLALLIFFVSVGFFLINKQLVAINYFFGNIDILLPWLLFLTFILGFFLSVVVFLPRTFRLQRKLMKLEKKSLLLSSKSDISK